MGFVLVTGGAGFIGSHIVQQLLDRGYNVRVLDDLSSGKRANLPQSHSRLEFIEASICNREVVEQSCSGVDAVIHLAALVSVPLSIATPEKSAEVNVTGFLNILSCLKKQQFKGRFLYASSSAVYGSDASEQPLCEDCAPGVLTSPYALDKYMNERYAELYSELYGIKTLGFRFFNVYGPRQDPSSQYSGVISIFMDRALSGDIITVYGDGLQTRDFVYVGDLAEILVKSLERNVQGVLNLGTGHSTQVNELADLVKKAIGADIAVVHKPPREGDILHSCANIGQMQSKLKSAPSLNLEQGLKLLLASLGR